MENDEFVGEVLFEPKPGFDLVKYGNVFTFNFNQEFAGRLKNILAEFHKHYKLTEPVLELFKNLNFYLDLPFAEEPRENPFYLITRFQHVYSVICEREFAQNLNQMLTQFLVQKRVSPALFSFAKQLEGALYPKRFDSKTRYADEF